MQHRAGILDLPSQLQINLAQRRIEAHQARTSGIHGHQREFHARTAPLDRFQHRFGVAER